MSTSKTVINGFQKLSLEEAKQVTQTGKARKWIEGNGQSVAWAGSAVRLLNREGNDWGGGWELEASMKGVLPEDWALEFSGGTVQEG